MLGLTVPELSQMLLVSNPVRAFPAGLSQRVRDASQISTTYEEGEYFCLEVKLFRLFKLQLHPGIFLFIIPRGCVYGF